MDDFAPMCSDCELDTAVSHSSTGQRKRSPGSCDQLTDAGVLSDSGDESVMSSCGSSASFRSLSRTFSPSAPTHSPSSDEGTSKQAQASSLVSPLLLQNQGFQDGWLRELEAMGVPTTDNLDEALRSEGRLAYMPPKERPTPSASSFTLLPSLFAQTPAQVQHPLAILPQEMVSFQSVAYGLAVHASICIIRFGSAHLCTACHAENLLPRHQAPCASHEGLQPCQPSLMISCACRG